ncbi:hypothetical protein HWQ46_25825 [Shewanella sp. D64]|uniref:hypothetical protein n=1 Tax=unclassified Shewanella TaxID=196818 RepID=UPI0022BA641C|nr:MULTISPECIES: hypothetical protein [unclassified Shewanella]MEC4728937.1 hypothetical protein [Shewanella sp. D64]MEC4740870.1 hypothetical protein [Shewanella sp. E94]WBJ96711.1 hypothetical protein HWQ47_06240 [Shewanella sp. MTB7]
MKNKQIDLNNHLFAQLERLGCEDLSNEQVRMEVIRSKAMAGLAREVVNNGRLALDVKVAVYDDLIGGQANVPAMLKDGEL